MLPKLWPRSHYGICILVWVFVILHRSAANADQSAQAILQHFYQASGGRSWQQFKECDSEGTISILQKSGTLRYFENLRSGGNRAEIEIPALDVKRADGNDPVRSWHQDAAGDIQLSRSDDPDNIDDRYLTSRAYWQQNFGGASVSVLAPQTEGSITRDGLQFEVPGGKGFTLWINRTTGLLDRVEGSTAKQFSDYRSVNGVLLPFIEKKPSGNNELTVIYTKRILRQHLENAAFAIPFRRDYQIPPSGEVTVPAEGGLIFQARINNQGPFKALFDTGSVNFMSERFAHQLGLKLSTDEFQFGTSSPATMQVRKAHVDTLQIGDLAVHDQTFYIAALPDDGNTPVLAVGYELLRRFAVKIDYERQSLTFYDGVRFRYSGSGTAVPLQIQGTALLVEASIGKASGSFLLDTGNEAGFSVSTNFTEKNGLVGALGVHFLGYNGRGYAGPSPEAYLVRVSTFRIGDVPAPSVIAHLTTDRSDTSSLAGNIGQSILRRFSEVVDCMRGDIYFERTKSSDQPEIFNGAGLIFDSFGHGLQVMTVLPGSPGQLAGLQPGDVITTINGEAPGDEMKPPSIPSAAGYYTPARGSARKRKTRSEHHVGKCALIHIRPQAGPGSCPGKGLMSQAAR